MRDLLIVAIVGIAAVLAVRRPWIGVLLWTWLSIMNPHRYAWGFSYSAPLAAIAVGATMVGLLLTSDRKSPFQGGPTVWLFLFTVWVTISWLLGLDVADDYAKWAKVMKIYFMTFVALMVIGTRYQIIAFASVTAGSLALLGAKGGLFTLITGGTYRVWGPPESFIEDNNEFALSLIVAIPLLYFLFQQSQPGRRWLRLSLIVAMALCAIAAIGTYSRGALLAIAAMAAMLWLRSAHKVLLGVVLICATVFALPMMPEQWWERMGTVANYQDDASAVGRLNAWMVAWSVAKTHVFGAGMSYQHASLFAMFGTHETTVRAAHSIYFQVLGNHGFIGLGIYLMIWISTYANAGWLRRNGSIRAETRWVADLGAMIQVCLVGYAVGGAFLSLAYFDLPYNIMVMTVLARRWTEREGWKIEVKQPLLVHLGLRRQQPRAVAAARLESSDVVAKR
jgi:probable O-glycosylation ligase (exosortase A-associated)